MGFVGDLVKKRNEEGRPRVDRGLPLDIRIGSKVKLPLGSWVLNKNRFLMNEPIKEGRVLFYGRSQIEGFSYYRFYIGTEDKTQVILQMRMYAGQVTECLVFTPFAEIFFTSEEDWARWTGDGGRLGLLEFKNDGSQTSYQRVWGNAEEDWVEPCFYMEEVTCGPLEADPKLEIGCLGMLFGRWVKEDVCAEHLLAELQEYEDKSVITIRIGCEVPHQAIKVHNEEDGP